MAVWVCLYIYRGDGGAHALSAESQQRLRERGFLVDAHADHSRIVDLREHAMTGGPAIIREAVSPNRLADLWRLSSRG